MPTRKMHAAMKVATGLRVGMAAAVYTAATTEYLVSEVLDGAGVRRRDIVRKQVK